MVSEHSCVYFPLHFPLVRCYMLHVFISVLIVSVSGPVFVPEVPVFQIYTKKLLLYEPLLGFFLFFGPKKYIMYDLHKGGKFSLYRFSF